VKPLIIIPTYNEIDNLRPLIQKVLQAAPTVSILVVDDGSPDGTGQLADSLSQENPKVQVLHRAKKMGLGTAYVSGFNWGLEKGFDALIEMDADFSHDPKCSSIVK
jgi:dolichol-phosphate mannosyltransferase